MLPSLGRCVLLGSLDLDSDGIHVSRVLRGQKVSYSCQCPGIDGSTSIHWTLKKANGHTMTVPETSSHVHVTEHEGKILFRPVSDIVLNGVQAGNLCCHQRRAWPGCVKLRLNQTAVDVVTISVSTARVKVGSSRGMVEQAVDVLCDLVAFRGQDLDGVMNLIVNGATRTFESVPAIGREDYNQPKWKSQYWTEQLVRRGDRLECHWVTADGFTVKSSEITIDIDVNRGTFPPTQVLISKLTPTAHVVREHLGGQSNSELDYDGDENPSRLLNKEDRTQSSPAFSQSASMNKSNHRTLPPTTDYSSSSTVVTGETSGNVQNRYNQLTRIVSSNPSPAVSSTSVFSSAPRPDVTGHGTVSQVRFSAEGNERANGNLAPPPLNVPNCYHTIRVSCLSK